MSRQYKLMEVHPNMYKYVKNLKMKILSETDLKISDVDLTNLITTKWIPPEEKIIIIRKKGKRNGMIDGI